MKSYMKLKEKINAEGMLELSNQPPSDSQGVASGPLNEILEP